ncbi:MAG TPA: hypothetical protein VHI54_12230 [Actinomycetota bacterium]|nr:hypothetical protein [Actinomycetota bacterium]
MAQASARVLQTEHHGSEVDELIDQLRPGTNRARVLRRLDEIFRSGTVPDPLPDGFLPGRLVAVSVWNPLDAAMERLGRLWMPWQGKAFSPVASNGVNRLTTSARLPLKALFPSYTPEAVTGNDLDAFTFRTSVGPGAIDRDINVFKVDYDFEPNPGLIRRVLDELVEAGPGSYLGKILFKIRGEFRAIGFFSLRKS